MSIIDEFIVDKEKASITIRREFDASKENVWKAWTSAEILDKWWGPAPWTSKTKHMSFEVGGTRLYAMCGPNGEEHWNLTTYHRIIQYELIVGEDSFCDEDANLNPNLPAANFEQHFEESGTMTLVTINTQYADLSQLEATISMGFQEGMTAILKQLDELFLNA